MSRALRALGIAASAALVAASVPAAPSGASASPRPAAEAIDIQAGCRVNENDVELCLNDPRGGPAERAVLINRLIRLVDAAGSDAAIRIAMYVWRNDDPRVTRFTRRLIEAQSRGVDVQILLDAKSKRNNKDTFDTLKGAFRQKLRLCDSNPQTGRHSCLANGGIQHNKLFVFNFGEGRKKTSVVSSSNLTGAITNRYNNMVVLRDDRALFRFYRGYFERMQRDNWDGWGAARRARDGSSGHTRGYVYPQVDRQHDSVAQILNAITECRDDARRVSVLTNSVHKARIEKGSPLWEALKGLPGNCDVRILLTKSKPGGLVDFINNHFRGDGVRARKYSHGDRPNHHSKYVLVDTQIKNLIRENRPRAERRYVWTGSLNLTRGLWTSANSDVLVQGQEAYRVYRRQFDQLWEAANR